MKKQSLVLPLAPHPVVIPRPDDRFWISEKNREILSRVAARSSRGGQVNVLVCGPKGCGKTSMAREFAARYGRPFHELHCGACLDAEQWFGKDRLNGQETWYRKSRFIQALETEGCTVLLDEINRAHPEVLGSILGLLDWRRSIWSDDLGYEIRVAANVVFFATLNEGEDYYGVNPLDAALRDRFTRILRVDYPPVAAESRILQVAGIGPTAAGKLAQFAATLRRGSPPVPLSTRQLLAAGEELGDGATLREAVETTILNGLEDLPTRKMALQALQWLDDHPFVDDGRPGPSVVCGHD